MLANPGKDFEREERVARRVQVVPWPWPVSRVTHDVNFDASLFRSTVVARPRIDLYAEHRKFGYHLRGGDSEVIGGEREVPLVPENVPLAWKMIGWILGGA